MSWQRETEAAGRLGCWDVMCGKESPSPPGGEILGFAALSREFPAGLWQEGSSGREAACLCRRGNGVRPFVLQGGAQADEPLPLSLDAGSREEMVSAYVHGLHWVLEYYYRGVASWNWCAAWWPCPGKGPIASISLEPQR